MSAGEASAGVTLWWRALTRRERRLLVVLMVVALPVFVWLAVVRPLADARTAAAVRLSAAQRDVMAMRALTPALRAAEGRRRGEGSVLERVRLAVAAAGLGSESLAQDGAGVVVLRLAAARGPVLLQLVAGLEADGLVVKGLSVSRNDDETVSASVRLLGAAR